MLKPVTEWQPQVTKDEDEEKMSGKCVLSISFRVDNTLSQWSSG